MRASLLITCGSAASQGENVIVALLRVLEKRANIACACTCHPEVVSCYQLGQMTIKAYWQFAAPRWEELVSGDKRVHERNQQVALQKRRVGSSANASFTFWLVSTFFRLFCPADDFDNVLIFEKNVKNSKASRGGRN